MADMANSDISPRVGRLDSARDVRREAARLYRAGRRGDVSPSDAAKLASVLALLIRTIETGELEERLGELESRVTTARR